jgi:transcriptional regulator with XRE-family HTH domain
VADRPIDRQAWAQLIASLIASETRGRKATFARLAGVDPKTIAHWLAGTVEVSEASVRRVATAVGRNPLDLLVSVGYYHPNELQKAEPGGQPAEEPGADPAMDAIRAADVPPRIRMRMVERLLERRERERERQQADELAEIQWWIEQAGGA